MSHLNQAALDIADHFARAVTGAKNSNPSWKRCVTSVGFHSYQGSGLTLVAGSMYVRRYFKPGTVGTPGLCNTLGLVL